MSILGKFKQELSQFFPVDDKSSVITSWEVSYAEVDRLVEKGFPSITIELPLAGAVALSFLESLYLTHLRYQGSAKLLVRPAINRAAYELLLIRTGGAA